MHNRSTRPLFGGGAGNPELAGCIQAYTEQRSRMLGTVLLIGVVLLFFKLLDAPRRIYRQYKTLKLLRAIPEPGIFPPGSGHWFLGHIPLVYKQNEELVHRQSKTFTITANRNSDYTQIYITYSDAA